jgi:hypothetical protein
MKNSFTDPQQKLLKDFLGLSKILIYKKKIPPAYLLYMVSKVPDDNLQNTYTKVNKVLLRDALNKKKRIYLDFLIKND